jgi:hypothetical protein
MPGDFSCLMHTLKVALIMDGGKEGNKRILMHPFKAGSKDSDDDVDIEEESTVGTLNVRTCWAFKSEASVRKNRASRGIATVKQVEHLYFVAPSAISLPERDWQNGLEGSNKGYNVPDPGQHLTRPNQFSYENLKI